MRLFFFFQAEDGIRDGHVTGVQTCALPISAGGQGPPQPGPPKSVSIWAQPEGRLEPSDLPAFFVSWVALAGMLTTSQCHQPAPPVGASGSCTSSAKLFVASGAPDQASAGETFSPEQPKPLYTCSMSIVPVVRMW